MIRLVSPSKISSYIESRHRKTNTRIRKFRNVLIEWLITMCCARRNDFLWEDKRSLHRRSYPALHAAIEIPRIALAPYFSVQKRELMRHWLKRRTYFCCRFHLLESWIHRFLVVEWHRNLSERRKIICGKLDYERTSTIILPNFCTFSTAFSTPNKSQLNNICPSNHWIKCYLCHDVHFYLHHVIPMLRRCLLKHPMVHQLEINLTTIETINIQISSKEMKHDRCEMKIITE